MMEAFEYKDSFGNELLVEQHEEEEFCVSVSDWGNGESALTYIPRDELERLAKRILKLE